MDDNIIVSRYTFLFRKEGLNFIFNSRTNSFYNINDETFDFLNQIKEGGGIPKNADECFLSQLKDKKILTTPKDETSYLDCLKLSYLSQAFSSSILALTIVPTVSCNLSCPYCFEQTKPGGIMDSGTMDKVVEFIKRRAVSKKYSINWFGGEPLIGLPVISSLLNSLKKEREYEMVTHSIVTNGTLLNDDAISLFQEFPLDNMQVTFDGFRDSHNSKRFFKSGEGTFDLILNKLSNFVEKCPGTNVDLRVNIDNTNREDYLRMHELVKERFNGCRVYMYPGILRANKGCEDETFFSSSDHLEFSRMLWKHRLQEMYPRQCNKGCCATSVSQYVIGPRGELYVCWEHVGKDDRIIGYIDGKPGTATDRYSVYKLKGHCFEDKKCLGCGLLPLCTGGCPDKRISNLLDDTGHNLCCVYGENGGEGLEDALFEYYKSGIK